MLLLLAAILLSSSCSLIFPQKINVILPPRPSFEACPAKPDVEGKIVNGKVEMELSAAMTLRSWISDYQVCEESNHAKALGHIEKLENRLKAVSQ